MLVEAPGLGPNLVTNIPTSGARRGYAVFQLQAEKVSKSTNITFSSEHRLRRKHSTREVSNNLTIKFNQQFISTLQCKHGFFSGVRALQDFRH